MPETINSQEWTSIGRPGFAGKNRDAKEAQLNQTYGQENWRMAHQVGEKFYGWLEALILFYEEAYFEYLKKNPQILDWLCKSASDVYDSAKTNVQSGLDYNIQEGTSNHMQDIAVRRVVQRLGRKFEGTALLQIRGRKSKGACLSPGVVPFHKPDFILQPELQSWWEPGSIESFWQSNKILLVKTAVLAQTGGITLQN